MALSAKTSRLSSGWVCDNHKPFWPPAAKPVNPQFLISYPHNPAASKCGNTVLPRESIRMRPANRGDNSTAAGTQRSCSRRPLLSGPIGDIAVLGQPDDPSLFELSE